MEVTGKHILLTGGSAGIGREMALQLRDAGAKVTITGRNPDRLEIMQDEKIETISADLSNAAGVDALLSEWGERPIDVLINNAGQLVDYDLRAAAPDSDEVDNCIYANLNAPIRLVSALVPRLRDRSSAAIVNVTSGLAIAPATRTPVYCATKAGLRSFTLALRGQLAKTPITVIEALPPVVDTQMNADNDLKKMSAADCARAIVEAIARDREEANIGMTKVLRAVESASPALARTVMLRF